MADEVYKYCKENKMLILDGKYVADGTLVHKDFGEYFHPVENKDQWRKVDHVGVTLPSSLKMNKSYFIGNISKHIDKPNVIISNPCTMLKLDDIELMKRMERDIYIVNPLFVTHKDFIKQPNKHPFTNLTYLFTDADAYTMKKFYNKIVTCTGLESPFEPFILRAFWEHGWY